MTAPPHNLITMERLGRMGRWGNQVFQYSFLRSYALRYRLRYECPRWTGQRLFGHNDPALTHRLPRFNERRVREDKPTKATELHASLFQAMPPDADEAANHDFHGYCQFHTSYYRRHREFLQDLFVPNPKVQERMEPALQALRKRGKTTVGIHLRRGDTGRLIFYLTPNEWYLAWLEEHWAKLDEPVLFVATEDAQDVAAFAKYNPLTTADLLPLRQDAYGLYNYLRYDLENPTPSSMDWFPDWYVLNHADILLFGESTFSFTAAMMNPTLQQAWRSQLSLQSFRQIDPWDAYPLVREHLADYPLAPDTYYDENPQWRGGEIAPR